MNDRLPLAWISRNQQLLADKRKAFMAPKACYHVRYMRHRRARDPAFRLLKSNSDRPSTIALLGCSIAILRAHLESQFKPGMSWDNYGLAWEVDHIRPCASFDLTDSISRSLCFQKSNLQPLWTHDNRAKGDKMHHISTL